MDLKELRKDNEVLDIFCKLVTITIFKRRKSY